MVRKLHIEMSHTVIFMLHVFVKGIEISRQKMVKKAIVFVKANVEIAILN